MCFEQLNSVKKAKFSVAKELMLRFDLKVFDKDKGHFQ